jgi:hypothetical protein
MPGDHGGRIRQHERSVHMGWVDGIWGRRQCRVRVVGADSIQRAENRRIRALMR